MAVAEDIQSAWGSTDSQNCSCNLSRKGLNQMEGTDCSRWGSGGYRTGEMGCLVGSAGEDSSCCFPHSHSRWGFARPHQHILASSWRKEGGSKGGKYY